MFLLENLQNYLNTMEIVGMVWGDDFALGPCTFESNVSEFFSKASKVCETT